MQNDECRVQNEDGENPPPDWATVEKDLLCPLCGYNLRGLVESRCPECGFKFTWRELIEAEKKKHEYVFEHGSGHSFKSFWKTYWRTCRPRRFWSDLNPAQPVRLFRLFLYWLLASGIMASCLSGQRLSEIAQIARENIAVRASPPLNTMTSPLATYTPAEMAAIWPLPWEYRFWKHIVFGQGSWYGSHQSSGLGWAGILLVWPWLTLISLFIFRYSMRQASIRSVHLLRTVVYSCDFGLLLAIAFAATRLSDTDLAGGWLLICSAAFCGVITTYRLTIAFRQYLRVHLPFATVLASQVIAFLIVFIVLVQIADFSRRI